MEKFGIFILIWGLCIIIYRTYIRFTIFAKYKTLIEELSIDRMLLFIPEIAPLKQLKQSNNSNLLRIYKIIWVYKFVFWIGLIITLVVLMLH